MSYAVVDADDLELFRGTTRRIRRALGVPSFGINQHEFPPGYEYPEHDERETDHEEVYACLRGSGTIVVDGEEVELRPGRFVRVTPESRRKIVPGRDGITCLVVGAPATSERGGWETL